VRSDTGERWWLSILTPFFFFFFKVRHLFYGRVAFQFCFQSSVRLFTVYFLPPKEEIRRRNSIWTILTSCCKPLSNLRVRLLAFRPTEALKMREIRVEDGVGRENDGAKY
jgi:hypothetical protein